MKKRKGNTGPFYQDEGWTTLERWMYVYVCVHHVPRICCQGVIYPLLCSHLLFSPPLLLLPPSLPLSSPSSLSPLPLLFFFPLLHFLLQLSAPAQLDSLAMMFCAVLIGGTFAATHMKMASNLVSIFGMNGQLL